MAGRFSLAEPGRAAPGGSARRLRIVPDMPNMPAAERKRTPLALDRVFVPKLLPALLRRIQKTPRAIVFLRQRAKVHLGGQLLGAGMPPVRCRIAQPSSNHAAMAAPDALWG